MKEEELGIILLDELAKIPEYAYDGDAGFDIPLLKGIAIKPGEIAKVGTGLAFIIPDGYELQVRLRSSTAIKYNLIMSNAPATIDSGYHGEVHIIVRNNSNEIIYLKTGERIAQAILSPVVKAKFIQQESAPESDRGSDGFGSTGS